MKNLQRMTFWSLVLVLAAVSAGCTPSLNREIIGEWVYRPEGAEGLDYEEKFKFSSNGKFERTEMFLRGERKVSGNFRIVDPNILELSFVQLGPFSGPQNKTKFRATCAVDSYDFLYIVNLEPQIYDQFEIEQGLKLELPSRCLRRIKH